MRSLRVDRDCLEGVFEELPAGADGSTTAQEFPLGACTAQRIFKCLFLHIS